MSCCEMGLSWSDARSSGFNDKSRIMLTFLSCRIAPAPMPGGGIGGFVAARYLCDGDPIGCAKLGCYFGLADGGLREHAGRMFGGRRARQHDIGKPLVLERHVGALDLLVRARSGEALGKVTPVRRLQGAL